MKNKIKMSLILNVLICFSSLIGLFVTLFGNDFMSYSEFLYYTIQSNIFALIMSSFFVYYDLKLIYNNNTAIPEVMYILKYIVTSGITITFLIFTFTLMPQMIMLNNYAYLANIGNLTLHFISPILSIIVFVLFDNEFSYNKKTCFLGTIMPWYYFFFSMFLSLISSTGFFKILNGEPSKFPYFFLDYEKNGWFSLGNMFELGVFYWIIIICLLSLVISKLLLKLKKD